MDFAQPSTQTIGDAFAAPLADAATLKVLSGLHVRTLFSLRGPSQLVGCDADCDMVLLDLSDGRIVFDLDDDDLWHVTVEAGQLDVDGSSVETYVPHPLPRDCQLKFNGVQLQFVAVTRMAVAHALVPPAMASFAVDEPRVQSADVAARTAQLTGLRRHALPATLAAVSVAAVIALPSAWRIATQSVDATPPSSTPAPVAMSVSPAVQNAMARQQISDYLNGFRMPIAVQAVTTNRIDLAWTGVDVLPSRVEQQIGTKLLGRTVAWVPGAYAVSDAEEKQSTNRGARRAVVDRGNRQTEETLRNLGLLDIASVQTSSGTRHFVLTRAGHRLYEGSELKTGAKLVSINEGELVVRSNGNTLLVPYDVSKPVRRLTNNFTAVALNEKDFDNAGRAKGANATESPVIDKEMNVGMPLAMTEVSKESGRKK
jgi:hypothetical protein